MIMPVRELPNGLKGNWREFKEYVEGFHSWNMSTHPYFVYDKEDCNDAYVFISHSKLDGWLAQKFWDWELYDTNDIESSMDHIQVWKLITESEFNRLKTLYKGAKITSITMNGERCYRKLIAISVQPTVDVSTNFY